MSVIFWLLFVLYILASGVLVLVVLVQSGKGGGLSSLVGAGTTLGDTLGASGVEKTLNRWTSYCAVGFLVINILLVILGPHIYQGSILDKVPLSSPSSSETAPGATAPVEGPIAPVATTGSEAPAAPATGAPAAEPQAEVPAPAPAAGPVAAPAGAPAPAPAGN